MVSSVWMKIQFCQQMRWVADDLSTNWHDIDVWVFLGTGEPRHWYFINKMRWDGHIPKTQGHQNTIIRHLESRISITELITKQLKYRNRFNCGCLPKDKLENCIFYISNSFLFLRSSHAVCRITNRGIEECKVIDSKSAICGGYQSIPAHVHHPSRLVVSTCLTVLYSEL